MRENDGDRGRTTDAVEEGLAHAIKGAGPSTNVRRFLASPVNEGEQQPESNPITINLDLRYVETFRAISVLRTYLDLIEQFVLQDQFEELGVREPVGFGFLQAHLQAAKQPREPQVAGILFKGCS